MNVFEYAMQMEKDGEKYYRELADKCNNRGLKSILNILADEEVKHYKVFDEMKKGAQVQFLPQNVLSGAKNIFMKMKEEKSQCSFGASDKEFYKKAQAIEKESEEFYRQKAEETTDEYQKNILLKIAEEEKKHYFLLGNIIEFVSVPETWLENSEFFHLDEY